MNRHRRSSFILAGLLALLLLPSARAGDQILTGNVLKVGISDGGSLIDSAFTVGIDQSPTQNGVFTGFDFLKPGTPFEFWSVGADGNSGTQGAGNYAYNAFGGTTTNTSAGSLLSTSTTGLHFNDISLSQLMSFGQNSGIIDFSVTLTNIGNAPLSNVVYARGLDPDQDVYAGGGYETTNTVVSGDLVTARAPVTDWTIGIYSNSSYAHTPTVQSSWATNPYTLLTPHNDGYGDYTINMGFDLGTLNVRESKTVTFQYRVAETHGEVEHPGVPDSGSTLSLMGVAFAACAGFMRIRRRRQT